MPDYVYFSGKGSWFHHLYHLDTMYAGPDDPGKWHITLHPDRQSLDLFQSLNLRNQVKSDIDGPSVKLSRPRKKVIRLKTGALKEIIFDPPKVFDNAGVPISEETKIGNGSDVTCKCELYGFNHQGRKGQAIRLESVRVDNLIPYNPPSDYLPDEAKAASGLMDHPFTIDEPF
jgi:hypothetical protein